MNPEGEGTMWHVEAPIDPPYEGHDVFPFVTIQPTKDAAIERFRWQVGMLDREITGEISVEETSKAEVAEHDPQATSQALEEARAYFEERGVEISDQQLMEAVQRAVEQTREAGGRDDSEGG